MNGAANWGDPRLSERFWGKTSPCPITGCWHWLDVGCNFRVGPNQLNARRVAYKALCGDPMGKVLPKCGTLDCVNPHHARIANVVAYMTGAKLDWPVGSPERHRYSQREAHLKRRYGITLADFDRMFLEQGGRCAICDVQFERSAGAASVHVDHCHKTGALRSLLCQRCNMRLGPFKDDPGLLRAAADYLDRHRKEFQQ